MRPSTAFFIASFLSACMVVMNAVSDFADPVGGFVLAAIFGAAMGWTFASGLIARRRGM
ncbi:hypothetical protein SEA_BEUFFERT_232 [Streptomyces phage Beuffert]|nr:hypothetical protein SEA_BEUFFERT_232 [Streptomyces phage Beuffert]